MERVKGIEPSSQAWEAHILPLNHTRFKILASPFLTDFATGGNCGVSDERFELADGGA